MKRRFLVWLTVFCVSALAGCGDKAEEKVAVDYGSSSLYTKEDMQDAIEQIQAEFAAWDGCELHSISYAGDAECNEANLAWMNAFERADGDTEPYTQCIVFESSFHSPEKEAGAWIADEEYTGWQWWLARSDGGQWKLMTWGY